MQLQQAILFLLFFIPAILALPLGEKADRDVCSSQRSLAQCPHHLGQSPNRSAMDISKRTIIRKIEKSQGTYDREVPSSTLSHLENKEPKKLGNQRRALDSAMFYLPFRVICPTNRQVIEDMDPDPSAYPAIPNPRGHGPRLATRPDFRTYTDLEKGSIRLSAAVPPPKESENVKNGSAIKDAHPNYEWEVMPGRAWMSWHKQPAAGGTVDRLKVSGVKEPYYLQGPNIRESREAFGWVSNLQGSLLGNGLLGGSGSSFGFGSFKKRDSITTWYGVYTTLRR
ncbi:hypothetical protein Dda_1624 [Drechslerella dactyloides]|uniref:Uncharacterized protein n=1 Tax=Drechslerella dactyloides TaxID=74499 RepID=A0AAD6NM91_DREDA|nr:hypothetical protein Dda_1624 [Drechslerella dactyloides]